MENQTPTPETTVETPTTEPIETPITKDVIETPTPTNANEGVRDLLTELKQATEKKVYSGNNNTWSFDVDDEKQTPPTTDTPTTQNSQSSQPNTPVAPVAKLDEKLNEAGSKMLVEMLDGLHKVIYPPLLNRKFSKRFNDAELKTLQDKNLSDAEKKDVADEDLPLYNKFNRLMKTRDEKLKQISYSADDKASLTTMFYEYQKLQGKLILTPGFVLIADLVLKETKCITALLTD